MIEGARGWRAAVLLFLLLAAALLSAQDRNDQPGQVSLTIYPARVSPEPRADPKLLRSRGWRAHRNC